MREPFNKAALLLLTFFLGGIGAHKFYLGKTVQGFFYLLFCWTFIPGFIALVEFFIYAFSSQEALGRKYPQAGSGGAGVVLAIVGGVFAIIVLIGILSALAIPKMFSVSLRAKAAEAPLVIANWEALQSTFAIEAKTVGDEGRIGFANPGATSMNWEYSTTLDGEAHATITATARTALGTCRTGAQLTSTYDAKTDGFVHAGDPACRKLVPGF